MDTQGRVRTQKVWEIQAEEAGWPIVYMAFTKLAVTVCQKFPFYVIQTLDVH
jgi:hypothetical protein